MIRRSLYWLLGASTILSLVHEQRFFTYGMSLFYLTLLVLLGLEWRELTLGPKKVWVPLAAIVSLVILSDFIRFLQGRETWEQAGLTVMLAAPLFGCYLLARVNRRDLTFPFPAASLIASLGVIAFALVHPGVRTGGYVVSLVNYNLACGVIVFGVLVAPRRWQWWLTGIGTAGVLLTGAEEGMFIMTTLVFAVLIRGDTGKKLLAPTAGVAVAVIIVVSFHGITIWTPAVQKLNYLADAITAATNHPVATTATIRPSGSEPDGVPSVLPPAPTKPAGEIMSAATDQRWSGNWRLTGVGVLGNGYNATYFPADLPHDIMLVITDQAGAIAAGAWLFVTGWGLMRTRGKYLFIGLLAMGVFDHYLWTLAASWWWIAAGMTTATTGVEGKDWIFGGTVAPVPVAPEPKSLLGKIRKVIGGKN
ncbi:MAG: hypothetical protein JRN35_06115 [Nitrososphaerota archaeon]|nr:hypothetical protein [Nitrososphaerota archaeon]